MKHTTMIIDDDADSRLIVRSCLDTHCPDLYIVAEADNVKEALVLFQMHQPDILLLDISLPDGTGFDLLRRLDNCMSEIIFITGHEQYALQALKFAAVDYLLKPLAFAELVQAIRKVETRIREKTFMNNWSVLLHNLQQQNSYEGRLAITAGNRILFSEVRDIVRLESQGNYTHFYFANGSKMVSSRTMGHYEDLLPADRFCRIHHSHIVNISQITELTRSASGTAVMLKDGTLLDVSQRKKEEVVRMITKGIK